MDCPKSVLSAKPRLLLEDDDDDIVVDNTITIGRVRRDRTTVCDLVVTEDMPYWIRLRLFLARARALRHLDHYPADTLAYLS